MWRCVYRRLSNPKIALNNFFSTTPPSSSATPPRSYSNVLGHTSRAAITSRNNYRPTISLDEEPNPTLLDFLVPSQNAFWKLDQWVFQGNQITAGELQAIIGILRHRKQFRQQVLEWMIGRGVCKLRKDQHLVQLDLIARVCGLDAAEEYLDNLGDEDKDRGAYDALLDRYVRAREAEKSVVYLCRMYELGFVSSPLQLYNGIMCLYTNGGQHEKVPGVLVEMKAKNIRPDGFSYRICINAYGVRSDLEGVKKVWKEMKRQPHIVRGWKVYALVADFYIKAGQTNKAIKALKKAERRLGIETESDDVFLRSSIYSKMENEDEVLRLDTQNGFGYNFLISLYANMGSKYDIWRLWGLKKKGHKRCNNRDHICMLVSLVRLAEFREAENLLKEWERIVTVGYLYDDFLVPETLIVGYSTMGLSERAETLLKDMVMRGKETTLESWEAVVAGYVAKGEVEKGVECLKFALNLRRLTTEGQYLRRSLMTTLLNELGKKCSCKDVEAFVGLLTKLIPMNRHMYGALLKAYIRGDTEVNGCNNPKLWQQFFA